MKHFNIYKIIFVLILFFLSVYPIHAQMGSMMEAETIENEAVTENHGASTETVLGEILLLQDVQIIQNVDCSLVSERDFERLGDAVMEQQHPGEAHEVMDRMMGGEGSETLQQMHIKMGKAYLDCEGDYGRGMMGGGMMGRNPYQRSDKPLPFGGMVSAHTVVGGVTWIVLIMFLVSGTYFFLKPRKEK